MHVAVGEKGLVTVLEGGFRVDLELGNRASQASEISFPSFSLVRADQGIAAIEREHLSVIGSKPTPLHVLQGAKETIEFRIGDQVRPGEPIEAMQISKGDFALVCGAGILQIVGTIEDSADRSRSTTVTSQGFLPVGCSE